MAAAARMAGVSGFKEVRVSARDESGEHRQFASQGGPPAPGSQGGQAQGQQVPNQRRREVIDPADIDPDMPLIHISEPTRLRRKSYAVFCLKKKSLL